MFEIDCFIQHLPNEICLTIKSFQVKEVKVVRYYRTHMCTYTHRADRKYLLKAQGFECDQGRCGSTIITER